MPRLVSDFAGMKATTQLSTDPGHREEKRRKESCSELSGGAKWQKTTRSLVR